MKTKWHIVSLLFIILLALAACEPNPRIYRDEYPALYAAANYSIFGMQTAESDRVFVVETDEYGRTLYFVYSYSPILPDKRIAALLIAQTHTDDEVSYYEKENVLYCFVDKVAFFESAKEFAESYFSKEQISFLKERNDWGKEINNEKYVVRPICTYDAEIKPISKENEEKIEKLFFNNNGDIFFDYMPPCADGTVVGLVKHRASGGKWENYILLFRPGDDLREEICICERIEEPQNHREQLDALLDEITED